MNTHDDLVSRITVDPEICYGRPHVRGPRVLVSLVLGFLASGSTPADILVEFPGMEEADVLACLAWAERRRATAASAKSAAA
jgi:uncharacterized protein (DUF433 family)